MGGMLSGWNPGTERWQRVEMRPDGSIPVHDTVRELTETVVQTIAAVAASYGTALTGTHNDLVFTHATPGVAGDGASIEFRDPGDVNQALSADIVEGQEILVMLATGADGAITSTAEEVRAACAASGAVTAIATVALAPGNTGAGVVTALAKQFFTGGADAIARQGLRVAVYDAEGNLVGTSHPLPVTMGTLITGERTDFGYLKGGSIGTSYAKLTASDTLKASPGVLHRIICAASTSGTVTLYNTPAANTNNQVTSAITLVAGQTLEIGLEFNLGIRAVIGGTLDATFVFS